MSLSLSPIQTLGHGHCLEGMDGDNHFLFGEAYVQGVRGDYPKVPLYFKTTRETQPYHLTSWMAPLSSGPMRVLI